MAHNGTHHDGTRAHGRGVEKLRRHGQTYAGLIAKQQSRRLGTLSRRQCKQCMVQFHSMGAKKRHACSKSQTN